MDDVVPSDEYSAMRDQALAIAQRRAAGESSNCWHGDVFIAIKMLVEHHPSIQLRTVVGSGNPQALLWQPERIIVRPIGTELLSSYSSVRYTDLFGSGIPAWFSPGAEDEILQMALTECSALRVSTEASE